jgi:hypothetical protein
MIYVRKSGEDGVVRAMTKLTTPHFMGRLTRDRSA